MKVAFSHFLPFIGFKFLACIVKKPQAQNAGPLLQAQGALKVVRYGEDKGGANLFLDEIDGFDYSVARIAPGGVVYHTLNRANGRNELFSKPQDHAAFERIMVAATQCFSILLLAYCLMPNHWRMVLWPKQDVLMEYFNLRVASIDDVIADVAY